MKNVKRILSVVLLIAALLALTGCGCDHEAVVDKAVKATCTATGLTEDVWISESGKKTELPQFNFQVDVPVSPLNVTSPAQERTTVVTGVYPLTLNVVPGSTVFVNGEDVTGSVDRSGYMP